MIKVSKHPLAYDGSDKTFFCLKKSTYQEEQMQILSILGK